MIISERILPKRVLHVVSAMDRGGAETLIMNIYRNVDKKLIQFDFVTHGSKKGDFDDEILSMGGKIYNIPSLGTVGPFKYLKQILNILDQINYTAIHAHTDYQGGFVALAGLIKGVKYRICHSHSSNWLRDNNILNKILLLGFRTLIKQTSTHLCSCSEAAADFLFGSTVRGNKRLKILKNGIDPTEYLEDKTSIKETILTKSNLPSNSKVIGHVGKFSESKNQIFLLKLLQRIVKEDPKFVLLFVGDGPLKNDIGSEVEKMGLYNHVRFLGVRSDIAILMKTFDVFVFPSLFEGFGIVMLEAQCSGIPCVASDAVPLGTDMNLGLVTYLSLDEDMEEWSRAIINATTIPKPSTKAIQTMFSSNGFHIKDNVNEWMSLYGIQYY
ncbi:glycogen synthase [Mycobacteroides abscessus subsp. abscessus]|nr:glycogen synthase [Mycobacteroides abscessus subsp. abscessus]